MIIRHKRRAVACLLIAGGLTVGALNVSRTSAATGALIATSAAPGYLWGVVGNDSQHLGDERAAGVAAKVVRVSWADLMTANGVTNTSYVQQKQAEIATLRQAGFNIYVDLGLQNAPAWVHHDYANSYYQDQYGDTYTAGVDGGDANLVFNPTMRALAAQYIQALFTNFGTDFAALRLGGGHYGELTYPAARFDGHTDAYWGFDPSALASNPVPHWRPGQPSPNGEASAFLTWYLQDLTTYQNWQVSTVRQYYHGALQMLYPGFGMRPSSFSAATADNLDGASSAESTGEVEAGTDYARQIAALTDANVQVYTTWIDCPYGNNTSLDPSDWGPVKYLAALARGRQPALPVSGENTGEGSPATMQFAVAQMMAYGLVGMNWAFDSELYTGQYATLADYQRVIANDAQSRATATSSATALPSAPQSAVPSPTPTNTAVPATNTAVPATNTAVPATNTAVPATNTAVPATNTAVPATNTATQTPGPAAPSIGPGARGSVPSLKFAIANAAASGSPVAPVAPGRTAPLAVTITANRSLTNELVDFEVYTSAGQRVWQGWRAPIAFVAGTPRTLALGWPVPATQLTGVYTFKVGVFTATWQGQQWDNGVARVTVETRAAAAATAARVPAVTATSVATHTPIPVAPPATATNTATPRLATATAPRP